MPYLLPHLSTLVKGSRLYPKNSQSSGWLLSKGMAIPSETLYFEEYMTSARANISSEYVHIIYLYSLRDYSVSPLPLPTKLSSSTPLWKSTSWSPEQAVRAMFCSFFLGVSSPSIMALSCCISILLNMILLHLLSTACRKSLQCPVSPAADLAFTMGLCWCSLENADLISV